MIDATRGTISGYVRMAPVTLCLVVATTILALWPAASVLAAYDRQLVCAGDIWRIVTCHMTHWNLDHLLWDVLVFGTLGAICEHRNRWGFLVCLGTAAVAIPLATLSLQPEMATYRGLSGLDTALFAMLAIHQLREKWVEQDWPWLSVLCLLLAGFVGKIAFELITGGTVFVDNAAAGFTPAPLAHLVGFIVGGLVGLANSLLSEETLPAPPTSTLPQTC